MTADGTIRAAGKNERLLRILAVPAAVLSCAWPIAWARKIPDAMAKGAFPIGFSLLFIAVGGVVVVRLAGRARGKVVWRRKDKLNPATVWTSLLLLNFMFASWLDWSKGTFHQLLYGVGGLSILLGIVGWSLEKKRGK